MNKDQRARIFFENTDIVSPADYVEAEAADHADVNLELPQLGRAWSRPARESNGGGRAVQWAMVLYLVVTAALIILCWREVQ